VSRRPYEECEPDAVIGDASRRRRRLPRQLEVVLLVIGFTCLAWAAWAWVDAQLFQRHAAATAAPLDAPLDAPLPAAAVAEGAVVCQLWIPRVGVGMAVAEGVSERTLRRAVGHVPGSPLPGQGGNIVLAGHRDTFFRSLERIRVGDAIYLESRAGTELYVVDWIRIVAPTDIEVLKNTGSAALTLVTCYPFRFIGSAPERFIVRARHINAANVWGSRDPAPAPTG
jgi:sortase A